MLCQACRLGMAGGESCCQSFWIEYEDSTARRRRRRRGGYKQKRASLDHLHYELFLRAATDSGKSREKPAVIPSTLTSTSP